jgi:protein-tyrosine-phosphatase
MDILYVCTKNMPRDYMIEAILNKICTINNIDPYVKDISIYSRKFHQLKNNIFLLLDKIRKIIVFK